MVQDSLCVQPTLHDAEKEHRLDWLTALLPIFLISVIYYRGQALALHVTAVGGYLMANLLLLWVIKKPWSDLRATPAVFCGLLSAFFLPATAPWWLSALLGGIAAVADAAPTLIEKVKPTWFLARPLVHSVVLAFLLVRIVFPAQFADYTMPMQFIPVDGLSAATPLVEMRGGEFMDLWQMLFGIHAAAIGEGCAGTIMLSAIFLSLRRRIRLIAPMCLLITVFLLSWAMWGALPYALYALLSGGLLLGCLLLADTSTAPSAPRDQIIIGAVVGIITVLIRRFGGWTEGVAVGILVAQVLVPFLPFVYKACHFLWMHFARWVCVAWAWSKPYLVRFFRFVAKKIATVSRWLWQVACRGIKAVGCYVKKQRTKTKK